MAAAAAAAAARAAGVASRPAAAPPLPQQIAAAAAAAAAAVRKTEGGSVAAGASGGGAAAGRLRRLRSRISRLQQRGCLERTISRHSCGACLSSRGGDSQRSSCQVQQRAGMNVTQAFRFQVSSTTFSYTAVANCTLSRCPLMTLFLHCLATQRGKHPACEVASWCVKSGEGSGEQRGQSSRGGQANQVERAGAQHSQGGMPRSVHGHDRSWCQAVLFCCRLLLLLLLCRLLLLLLLLCGIRNLHWHDAAASQRRRGECGAWPGSVR